MELVTLVFAGIAAGAIHALSGPDHLAAVTPLTIDNRLHAAKIGLLWGLGHAGGVAVIGTVALSLRELIVIETLSVWSERVVGVMLIAVGFWGLRKAFVRWFHTHQHQHGSESHTHVHFHRKGHAREHSSHAHAHASWGMGLIHGIAGTSHIVGILPALALPSTAAAVGYLCGYGVGNLVAMGTFTWLIGRTTAQLSRRGVDPYRTVLGTCSAVSVAIGLGWLAW